MSIPIFVGGTKGGSTKSSTAHLLALGAILCRHPAAYVLTDPDRELRTLGRPYSVLDGREPQHLADILRANESSLNGWLFIDGGGNRPKFDEAVASECSICLLPFKDSKEDVDTVLKDLARIPNALAWPSAWPTNEHAKTASQRHIDAVTKAFPLRLITPPISFINSAKPLLDDELGNPSTEVRSAARRTFQILTEWIEAYAPPPAETASKTA